MYSLLFNVIFLLFETLLVNSADVFDVLNECRNRAVSTAVLIVVCIEFLVLAKRVCGDVVDPVFDLLMQILRALRPCL